MSIHKGFLYDVNTIKEMQSTIKTLFPDFLNNKLLVRPETKDYLKLIDMNVDESNIHEFHNYWN